jgi:hypothetical protein
MSCEGEAANVWAAMLGLALLIALAVTVGYWLIVYHSEAAEINPYLLEPTSALEMILDDICFH